MRGRPRSVEDLHPNVRDQAREILGQGTHQGPTDYDKEQDLLNEAMALLRSRGYLRNTRENHALATDRDLMCVGWYTHLDKPKGNKDQLPDLVVTDFHCDRCLHAEAKLVSHYKPGQKQMIEAGAWVEFRTVETFDEQLTAWEV